MAKFYEHFAAAYGTIWFVMMLYAIVSQSHVNAGAFGLYGFPIIAFVYALIRNGAASAESIENAQLRKYARELEEYIQSRERA